MLSSTIDRRPRPTVMGKRYPADLNRMAEQIEVLLNDRFPPVPTWSHGAAGNRCDQMAHEMDKLPRTAQLLTAFARDAPDKSGTHPLQTLTHWAPLGRQAS